MKKSIGKTRLKVNDNIVVISGSDKGRSGKILNIGAVAKRCIVEGINKRNKYIKPSQENPSGGMITIEFPIQLSNVMFFCDKCKKGVRVGIKKEDSGKKVRVCKKCGKVLD